MEQKQTPDIAGLITSEEHEVLVAHNENDPRLHELRERLGDAAGAAVAILASEGEEGPASYIVIGGENHGDSIRNYESFGLPDPTDLAKQLKEQQVDVQLDGNGEFDVLNASLIEQLEAAKPLVEFVDTSVESSRSIASAMGEIEDLWKQMKYNTGVNETSVSDLVAQLHAVRERITSEQEPTTQAILELTAISGELEAMQHDSLFESSDDTHERDKTWYALQKAEEGLQEAHTQLRSTSHIREDIVDYINNTLTQLDQRLQDTWGHEAYESQISGYLDKLASEPQLQPYAPLSRAQAALEDVTRIKAKLISKDW